jgi:hypothetical protein
MTLVGGIVTDARVLHAPAVFSGFARNGLGTGLPEIFTVEKFNTGQMLLGR